MALYRPIVDVNGNLVELQDNNYIRPNLLGSGVADGTKVLAGNGNWVTVASLNYWTKSGNNLFYTQGDIFTKNIESDGYIAAYSPTAESNQIIVGSFNSSYAFRSYNTNPRLDIIDGYANIKLASFYRNGNVIIGNGVDNGFAKLQVSGAIQQSVTNTILKANANGVLVAANATDVTSLLGAGSYIQNQNSTFQSANFRILGDGAMQGNLWVGQEVSTNEVNLNLGSGRTGNGYAYIDLVGDTTYTDYGLRLIRNNTGQNTNSIISHRGTGTFSIHSVDGGSISHQVGSNFTYISNVGGNSHYGNVHGFHNIGFNGTQGFIYIIPGNTTNAGYLAIYNSAQNRLGYIGYDNANVTYVAESGANHVFLGNKVLIGTADIYSGSILQVNGSITQRSVLGKMLYADSNGTLTAATAANIAATLGTGSYIQNQFTGVQSGNFWISGKGRTSGLTIDVNANDYAELYFRKAGVLQFNLYSYTDSTNNLYLASYNDTGGYITNIFTANRLNGNISFTNNVGIGTISPLYKLDVNGTIHAGQSGSNIRLRTNGSTLLDGFVGTDSTGNIYLQNWTGSRGIKITPLGKILINTNSENGTKILQIQGGIRQTDVISGLVYANDQGEFQTATADNVATLLGTAASGNYIQNQYGSPQNANSWISGIQRADEYTKSGRRGYFGTYDYTQVQGIWSISETYPIDIANNTFGSQYGIVYAYEHGTTNVARRPLAGYSHQVLFVGDGLVNAAISVNTGAAYFKGNLGIGISNTHSRLHIDGYNPRIWVVDSNATNTPYYFQELIANGTTPYMQMQVGDYAAYRNLVLQPMGGKVIVGGNFDYGSYKLQVLGESLIHNGMLHIESASPTIRFRDSDGQRGAYIHVNSNLFYILRMNDSGTGWETNSSGLWPMHINLENNNAHFGGAIQQDFVKSSLVYADVNGYLNVASAQNVRDLLGTGSYIQNQFAGSQSGDYWIGGSGRVGPYTVLGIHPRFTVTGSHSDTTISLYSVGNGATTSSLDLWASEPGLTFDGSGIGNNINTSPYYGRRNTSLASSYIRFYNGHIFFSSSTTERTNPVNSPMILSNTEKLLVGFGADVNDYKVQINSGFATGAGLYVNGNINATGNIIADGYFSGTQSDIWFKSDFKNISVIDVIDNINIQSYAHSAYNNNRMIGSVAQELQKYFPELISKDGNNKLRVDNYGYSALALQLGKELKSEVDTLKDRIKELEKQVEELSR